MSRSLLSRRLRPARLSLLALAATGLTAAGLTASGALAAGGQLHLVAYSVPQAAYASIIPAFERTPAGKGWTFTQSYGGSGDQTRAVLAGLPADLVALSLEPDVTKLVQGGLAAPGWSSGRYHGIVTDSVVVFVVRKGNPKHIKTWDDLVKPGVKVVTPNPFASGGARWNLLAGYGAELTEHKTAAQAQAFLGQLLHNTVSQDTSARNALNTFLGGRGDVLLDYEDDAIGAQRAHQPVQYLVPSATILIENPVAVVKSSSNATEAQKFVSFLYTPAAQRIFAINGFRPVIPGVVKSKSQFPKPKHLFRIVGLGGWASVNNRFFDPKTGIVAKIEQGLGVSTGK